MHVVDARRHDVGAKYPRSIVRSLVVTITLLMAIASLATVSVAPPAYADDTPSRFVAVSYSRLYDTQAAGPFSPQETRSIKVLGVGGVPTTGVSAVVVDVAAISSSVTAGSSSISVWTTGTPMVSSGILRVSKVTAPVSNTAIIAPSSSGQISIYNSAGTTGLNVDVQGYFTTGSGGGFHAIRDVAVDTAAGVGTAGAFKFNETRNIQLDSSLAPAGATAVFANVIVKNADYDGSLSFYPRGEASPSAKSMNYSRGGADVEGLTIPVDSSGGFSLRNQSDAGSVDIKIEVQGYFLPAPAGTEEGGFRAVSQATVLPQTSIPAGDTVEVRVGGTNGVPQYGAEGAVLNVTALNYTSTGNITTWSKGAVAPSTGTVQFAAVESATDGASVTTVIKPGLDGMVLVKNPSSAPVTVKVSLLGWFSGYRAVAADSESTFVANATALGVPDNVARLAVWDANLAAGIPTAATIEQSTAAEDAADDVTMTTDGTASSTIPSAPSGSLTDSTPGVVEEVYSSDPVVYSRSASPKCSPGYTLRRGEESRKFENYVGMDLYLVRLKKRWCSRSISSTTGVIESTWAKQYGFVYGKAESFISDKGTYSDWSKNQWLKADGTNAHSGHYTQRVRIFRYCGFGGVVFCYNTDVFQGFSAFWNGNRQSWTTADTDW